MSRVLSDISCCSNRHPDLIMDLDRRGIEFTDVTKVFKSKNNLMREAIIDEAHAWKKY